MKNLVFRPWFVMTLIFLLGTATGALLTIGLGHRIGPPPGAQEIQNRWMTRLTHRLHLTDDQQAKIQPIVTDAGLQIQSARRENIGRISGIMEAADKSISAMLDPAQQEELKKMERDREQFFSGRMHGMHRLGPGGGGNEPPSGTPPPAP
jgi:hypothetical protein